MQLKISFLLLGLYLCLSNTGYGQTVTQYDINTSGLASTSEPESFVDFNGKVCYMAVQTNGSTGLFEYDGSSSTLVFDVGPTGPKRHLEAYNGALYFLTGSTNQLMSYDGSTVATVHSFSGTGGCFEPFMQAYNGVLYFVAYDNSTGTAIYQYDGTTVSVFSDGRADTDCNQQMEKELQVINNELYFIQRTDTTGEEVFKFDGTSITALLVDAGPGSLQSKGIIQTPFGIMWTTYTSTVGNEWYIYNGTTVQLAADNNPGSSNGVYTQPQFAAATSSHLYFGGEASSSIGVELYQYDGTSTSLVQNLAIGTGDSRPTLLTTHNDTLYFLAEVSNDEIVYRYDGSTVTMLINLDDAGNFDLHDIAVVNDEPHFVAASYTGEMVCWKYDPALGDTVRVASGAAADISENQFVQGASGTYLTWTSGNGGEPHILNNGSFTQMADHNQGTASSSARDHVWVNNAHYFIAETAEAYNQLFRMSSGTPQNLPTQPEANITDPIAFNGTVYMSASLDSAGNSFGDELCRLDLTADTLELVADIRTGSSSSSPGNFAVLDGILYFKARDDAHGPELWKYDPVANSASMISDIRTGISGSNPQHLTPAGNTLYFVANDGIHGDELWQYNPGTDSTSLVVDIRQGSSDSRPNYLVWNNSKLYFTARDPQDNDDYVWIWDGTDTTRLMAGWPVDPDAERMLALGEDVYFHAEDSVAGEELFRIFPDNSVARVTDIDPGAGDAGPTDLTAYNGAVFFKAEDATGRDHLWRYDPVTNQASLAYAFSATSSSTIGDMYAHGDTLWLRADAHLGAGTELWSYVECTRMTSLRERNLQDVSVKLDWDADPNATVYRIEYKQTGTSGWNLLTKNGNPATKMLTGLTPTTNYRWRVQSNCGNGWSPWSEINSFRTLAQPCTNATGFSTTAITSSQARLNWTPASSVAKYKIRWRQQGGSWSYVTKDKNWDKHWLAGLAASTTYEWQVKTICPGAPAGTGWSSVQTFSTPTMKMADNPGELLTADNASIGLHIAPNPSTGTFVLRLPAQGEACTIQIIDPLGKVVYQKRSLGNQTISDAIDVSGRAKGFYFVRLTGNSINYTSKVMVQ